MVKRWPVLFALMLAPAGAGAATLSDARVGFSADRTLVVDGHTYTGKIWAMPGRERHEQALQAFRPVFLLRADSAIAEIVLPQLKTIVQFAVPAALQALVSPEIRKHATGEESVAGIPTTKYAVAETTPEGSAAGTLWLSRDGILMRLVGTLTATGGKVTTVRWELKNVHIGPQPDALFEQPSGFAKLPPEAVAPLLGLKLKSAKSTAR